MEGLNTGSPCYRGVYVSDNTTMGVSQTKTLSLQDVLVR